MPYGDGRDVAALLEALIRKCGAPLVLKHDNESCFLGPGVGEVVTRHGILHLRSPSGTPELGSACEAGIGGLKYRAHLEAARNGRPGEWTCDDLEYARQRANATARAIG